MTDTPDIQSILEADQAQPSARAVVMVDAIKARHGDNVRAFLFYGSGLREDSDPGKMLDFYVLVDSYKKLHGFGPKALASFLVPPSVHYLETKAPDGQMVRSKYSIVSLSAFRRRARGAALETMLWARFSQPTIIIGASPDDRSDIMQTLELAIRHFASEIAPIMQAPFTPLEFWSCGLCESYRTELRAEDSKGRARDLVAQFADRYEQIFNRLDADGTGQKVEPSYSSWAKTSCRIRWFMRRVVGKPMTAVRVLKAATTFDNGLDYVLHKLKSHSGVSIEVTAAQRRHPILFSPVLAWKLYRRGAFR